MDSLDNFSATIAIGILILTGISGLIGNLANIYIIFTSAHLQNSFGYLCASHSLSEILNLLIVCGWSSYVAAFAPFHQASKLGLTLGQAAAGLCLITSYTVLLKAVNRYLAFSAPIIYFKWFSTKSAIALIGIVWIFGVFHSIPFFFESCDFIFSLESFLWSFSNTACGNFYAFYIDFLYSFLIMALVVIFDSLTLVALIRFRKHFSIHQQHHHDSKVIGKKDIQFFIQSCGTTFLQILMLISFHLLSRIVASSWGLFFTTTFAWAFCNAADGIFNTFFNIRYVEDHKTTRKNFKVSSFVMTGTNRGGRVSVVVS